MKRKMEYSGKSHTEIFSKTNVRDTGSAKAHEHRRNENPLERFKMKKQIIFNNGNHVHVVDRSDK